MHTRTTSDYTPTMPGSKEENAAIVARKEMMKVFASREPKLGPKRKTWHDRMHIRANDWRKAGPLDICPVFDSPQGIKRHKLKQAAKQKAAEA